MRFHQKFPIGLLSLIAQFGCYLACSNAFSDESSWYDQKYRGWYYFDEDAQSEKKKEEVKPQTPEEAAVLLEIQKKTLANLLALAIQNPTLEHLENYIRQQKKIVDQSVLFSQVWETLLLKDPTLGDFLENPSSSYGILARRAFHQQAKEKLLQALSQDHFLLFFFEGGDFFSEKAAEVAMMFAKENKWLIKSVSVNGSSLPNLPSYEVDRGISQAIGVKGTPSFFIVSPQENIAIPVGAGLLSLSQLEENIFSQFSKSDEAPSQPAKLDKGSR